MGEHKTTALVTGASSGLGAEFCRQLAGRCEVIIAVARRGARLAALAEELRGSAEVHPLAADLNTVDGVARAVEALRQLGPVDYLVNNAGFATRGAFEHESIDRQLAMVNLHIGATLSLCRAAIPFMRDLGGGVIINVSSVDGCLLGGAPAVYGATKAFLNHYSQSLQMELAGSDVRVQALCPGFVRTELFAAEAMAGFEPGSVADELWMEPAAVVTASLDAIDGGEVVVMPGASGLALAQAGAGRQALSLQQ
jgi:short-subunit dehydrogenase